MAEQATVAGDQATNLLDYLIVLAKHKKLVFGVSAGVVVIAVLISFLVPNFYTATAKILPPQQAQSSTSALLAQFGALMGGAATGPLAFRNPNDLYVAMLKSRTVADNLIAKFDLKKLYGKDTMFHTRRKLADRTSITSGRDGIIVIEFEDRDASRAAAIANAYAEELYKLTTTLAVTDASQRRLFFEGQLKQAREQLAQAEVTLRQAIDKGGLAGVDVQSRAILEPSAQLRAQIALREVQLSAIRIFATEQHPDIERLRHEIVSMKRELARLEGGDGKAETSAASSAGLENLRRFKDVKFLERLTELLTQQFEAAKIDEAKEISIIQVLDRAIEPDIHSFPKRGIVAVVAALMGLLVGIASAFLAEAAERMRQSSAEDGRLATLRRYLRLSQ